MEIVIDTRSGFCFGVKRAIGMAEKESEQGPLYCLGEIVHNGEEVKRLEQAGIRFIDRTRYFTLSNCRVLLRAHGEPPEIYQHALNNGIRLIDATCPVVLKLQEKVRNALKLRPEAQVIIYGKATHPEVIALQGQTPESIILSGPGDYKAIDFNRPVFLFAQTTMDRQQYALIKNDIALGINQAGQPSENLIVSESICGQVANRAPWLEAFSKTVNVLIFVGGKNSSNSKVLFDVCKSNNPNSFFITSADGLSNLELPRAERLGLTGATSTPSWLIREVADKLESLFA